MDGIQEQDNFIFKCQINAHRRQNSWTYHFRILATTNNLEFDIFYKDRQISTMLGHSIFLISESISHAFRHNNKYHIRYAAAGAVIECSLIILLLASLFLQNGILSWCYFLWKQYWYIQLTQYKGYLSLLSILIGCRAAGASVPSMCLWFSSCLWTNRPNVFDYSWDVYLCRDSIRTNADSVALSSHATPWASIHSMGRHHTVKSREVSKPRDWVLYWFTAPNFGRYLGKKYQADTEGLGVKHTI